MKFCPHCGENLERFLGADPSAPPKRRESYGSSKTDKYDPVSLWRDIIAMGELMMGDPRPPDRLGAAAAEGVSAGPSIVHIMFDRLITPAGGAMYNMAMADGSQGASLEELELMGYVIRDGKVATVDDVPIGKGYEVITYWGGEKQFRRWHLSRPVRVNPSRGGPGPLFMDDNLVAFEADWADTEKAEEALTELANLFVYGPRNSGLVAIPVAMLVTRYSKA